MNTVPRILVVDDTEKNSRLLVDLLNAKGHHASAVASGEEALARIESEPPDLVLLDVMMPGLSGYDVCERLRADPLHAFLPIVLVTALDPAKERVRGLEAGADDFLTKPINPAELLARVRSLLRVKTLRDEVLRLRAAPGGDAVAEGEHELAVLRFAIRGLHAAPGTPASRALREVAQAIRRQASSRRGRFEHLNAEGAVVVFAAADAGGALQVAAATLAQWPSLAASAVPEGATLAAGIAIGQAWVGPVDGPAGPVTVGAPMAAAAALAAAASSGALLVDTACRAATSPWARFDRADDVAGDGGSGSAWRLVGLDSAAA